MTQRTVSGRMGVLVILLILILASSLAAQYPNRNILAKVFADIPHYVAPDVHQIPCLVLIKDAQSSLLDYQLDRVDLSLGGTIFYSRTYNLRFINEVYNLHVAGYWYGLFYFPDSLLPRGEQLTVHVEVVQNEEPGDPDPNYGYDCPIYLATDAFPHPEGWLSGDLNTHSTFTGLSRRSTAFGAPLEAYAAMAQAAGLDYVAITDHSFDLTADNWTTRQHDLDILPNHGTVLIPSEEVDVRLPSDSIGQLLAVGVGNFIASSATSRPTLADAITQIRAAGGIPVIAHPKKRRDYTEYLGLFNSTWLGGLDLPVAEIWNTCRMTQDSVNGYLTFRNELGRSKAMWTGNLGRGGHMSIGSGSDAYGDFSYENYPALSGVGTVRDTNNFFGVVRTFVKTTDRTASGIKAALNSGKTIITNGPFMSFSVSKGTAVAELMDSVTGPGTYVATFEWLSTTRFGVVDSVVLFGGPVDSVIEHRFGSIMPGSLNGSDTLVLTSRVPMDHNYWLRAEAYTSVQFAGGPYFSLTSPIWIRQERPPITSVTHDATGPLREDDILTVTLAAPAGYNATFDLVGFRNDIPLYDDGAHGDGAAEDGTYAGTFRVGGSYTLLNLTVLGWIRQGDITGNLAAETPVSIQNPGVPAITGIMSVTGGLQVNWDLNTDPFTSGYVVERIDAATGAIQVSYDVATNTVTDTLAVDNVAPTPPATVTQTAGPIPGLWSNIPTIEIGAAGALDLGNAYAYAIYAHDALDHRSSLLADNTFEEKNAPVQNSWGPMIGLGSFAFSEAGPLQGLASLEVVLLGDTSPELVPSGDTLGQGEWLVTGLIGEHSAGSGLAAVAPEGNTIFPAADAGELRTIYHASNSWIPAFYIEGAGLNLADRIDARPIYKSILASGLAAYRWFLRHEGQEDIPLGVTGEEAALTADIPEGDGYYLAVQATDAALNVSPDTVIGPFRVDITAPVFDEYLRSPGDIRRCTEESLVVSYRIHDALSGLSENSIVRITLDTVVADLNAVWNAETGFWTIAFLPVDGWIAHVDQQLSVTIFAGDIAGNQLMLPLFTEVIEPNCYPYVAQPEPNLVEPEDAPETTLVYSLAQVFAVQETLPALTFGVTCAETLLTVTLDDAGFIHVTPAANYNGTAWIAIVATNSVNADMAIDSVMVTIEPVNDPPIFVSSPVLGGESSTLWSYTPLAQDVDGDALTYLLISGPVGMRMRSGSTEIIWVTTTGEWPVVVAVTDGIDTVTQEFTLAITPHGGTAWSGMFLAVSEPAADSVYLNLGANPRASEGYDRGIDVIRVQYDPYAFDFYSMTTSNSFRTDIRTSYADSLVFTLRMVNSRGRMQWHPSELPTGSWILNGTVNMLSTDNYAFLSYETVHIVWRFVPASMANFTGTIHFDRGWNGISISAANVPAEQLSAITGLTVAPIYAWDPAARNYATAVELVPGQGYFILMDDTATVEITGDSITTWDYPITNGWNFLGTTSQDVYKGDLVQQPESILVLNSLYWARGAAGNQSIDTLKACMAVWALAQNNGMVSVTEAPLGRPSPYIGEGEELGTLAGLTLTSDARGLRGIAPNPPGMEGSVGPYLQLSNLSGVQLSAAPPNALTLVLPVATPLAWQGRGALTLEGSGTTRSADGSTFAVGKYRVNWFEAEVVPAGPRVPNDWSGDLPSHLVWYTVDGARLAEETRTFAPGTALKLDGAREGITFWTLRQGERTVTGRILTHR